MPSSISNTPDDGNLSEAETSLITEWFSHTPRELLPNGSGVSLAVFDKIPIISVHPLAFVLGLEARGQCEDCGLVSLGGISENCYWVSYY